MSIQYIFPAVSNTIYSMFLFITAKGDLYEAVYDGKYGWVVKNENGESAYNERSWHLRHVHNCQHDYACPFIPRLKMFPYIITSVCEECGNVHLAVFHHMGLGGTAIYASLCETTGLFTRVEGWLDDAPEPGVDGATEPGVD